MKRVLMVAYHFPPLAGSSGIQRALRFVQHLPSFGWEPLVLTVRPTAYEHTSSDLDSAVPVGTIVRRSFGLDTARHLAIGGRYAAWTARPDRWMTWRFDGVRQGLQMIREFKPNVLWSTYPIATAHLIGADLQQRSGLPWIADFRDPMAQDDYPSDPVTWQQYADIESRTVRQARLSTFTTPSAARLYTQRYPDVAARMAVLENGYDEESFPAPDPDETPTPLTPGCLTLLHSGVVYATERDPTQLFGALRRLKEAGKLEDGALRIRFRAAVHEDLLHQLAAKHQVQDCIEVCPPIPYRDALHEMMRADGLLVLQAANCNAQIPAKIYEYLRAGRPVLCLSHPEGDTEAALRSAGIHAHAQLDDSAGIEHLLTGFVADVKAGRLTAYLPSKAAVEGASRRGRTLALAAQLERLSFPT
jgi:glycosyltransferase involved in cell wall biosynthesis